MVALGATAPSIANEANRQARGRAPDDLASDEAYWAMVAGAYRLDGRYTILNGGGNNPHPAAVTDALSRFNELTSTAPRPHNYTLQNRIEVHRTRLARLMGCSPDELAITRNTTEGLNIVGWGLPLQTGDEVLISSFDDFYAHKVFAQRASRHGIRLTQVELPIEPTVPDVVDRFAAAFTSRTKLIVASHVTDGWGHVLPIRELSDLAHRRGAQCLADGALGFGQIPVDVRELGCDYYATSLHKWLNAPLGTGALYVRRDRLEGLWPLYGTRRDAGDIRKFEDIGTRSGPTLAAIGQAIDFYEKIGPARKASRLRYLLNIALTGLEGAPGVRVATERDPDRRAGLARIMVSGATGVDLTSALQERFQIFTYGNFPGPHDGVYISPNVFNSARDMEWFTHAIRTIAVEYARGAPQ